MSSPGRNRITAGLGVLLTLGFLGLFVGGYGDCFRSEAECAAVQVAGQRHAQIGFGLLALNTSIGVAALVIRSRRATLLLAAAAGMTLLIALLVWLGPLRDFAGIGTAAMLFGAAILFWSAVTELGRARP